MDTREKILTAESALAVAERLRLGGVPFHVVTGYFDVLQPAMVRELQRLSSENTRLFALVLNPDHALLGDGARAELAASLRVIDYVIPCPGDLSDLLETMGPEAFTRAEASHAESTEQLREHVFERHSLQRERRPRN